MKFWKRSMTLCLILGILGFNIQMPSTTVNVYAKSSRVKVAKQIADICTKKWDKYGRLPSVAIGQAFVESGLGKASNLFGCKGHSGRSVNNSTIGYLKVLNNQYFRGEGAFILSHTKQLSIIMKGGRYCAGQYPGGSYYHNVIRSIKQYDWRKYDKPIIRKVKERKAAKLRKKRQKQKFTVKFTEELFEGTAMADPRWIKKGSTVIYMWGIVEVTKSKKGLRNTLLIGTKLGNRGDDESYSDFIHDWIFDRVTADKILMSKNPMKLEVVENAKG